MIKVNSELALLTVPLKEKGNGVPSPMIRPTYVSALMASGFTPLPVFPGMSKREARQHYDKCAVVVGTGGNDYNPLLYHQQPHPMTQEPDHRRDEFDQMIYEWILEDGRPYLGICRSAQGLGVAHRRSLGVTDGEPLLLQHLPDMTTSGHDTGGNYDAISQNVHSVDVLPDTIAASIYPQRQIQVTCGHHQALNPDALVGLPGIIVSGISSDDNVVEIVELEQTVHPFAVGPQWHPEVKPDLAGPLTQRLKREGVVFAASHNNMMPFS